MTYTFNGGKSPEQFQKGNYQPTSGRDLQKLTGSRLQEWVNSIGGASQVSKKLGYSVRQFERFFAGQAEIPKVIEEYVKISDYNFSLKQENARLKRKNFFTEQANKL